MNAINSRSMWRRITRMPVGLAVLILMFPAFTLLPCGQARASGEEEAVLKAVQEFFDSMTERDVDAAKEVMLPDGQFYSVREEARQLKVRRRTHQEYYEGIQGGAGKLVETMREPTVLIHGRIAVVWTPYNFYKDDKFSHCGVDAFTLIKMEGGWKIAGIAYTVEPDGCESAPPGPANKEN